jgi:hypothetical protein
LDQKNKKARKLSLAGFRILAPRPGLEPGTCGLKNRKQELISIKSIRYDA